MRKAFTPAFLLILGSMVLATTVFAEPFAWAARPLETILIGNDESTPVPVREQGTVDVNVTNAIGVSEQRFSVVQQAFSSIDNSTNCTDLTTLPGGTLLIENIDVHAFRGMEAYLSASSESPTAETFSVGARIGVQLAAYPGSPSTNGHTATTLLVRDGGLAASAPGEATRDEDHPVRLCVRDDDLDTGHNSFWTVSGRVVG